VTIMWGGWEACRQSTQHLPPYNPYLSTQTRASRYLELTVAVTRGESFWEDPFSPGREIHQELDPRVTQSDG